MNDVLTEYLSRLDMLSPEDLQAIASQLKTAQYKKGTVLLKEGEVSSTCYFILEGCIRQYCTIDGDEKTTAFYTEEQAVVPFASYAQQQPSTYALVCVEDCTLIEGHPEEEQAMYAKFPVLAALTRRMMEQDFGKTQEDFAAFITSSPEERYLSLLKNRPGLLQRVPQHQLASYIGVTAESLSRIRKRITLKK